MDLARNRLANAIFAEFDLRHLHYDPAGATERSVTSDTSHDDFLATASSGMDSRGL